MVHGWQNHHTVNFQNPKDSRINEKMQKKKLHFFLTRDMKTFVCKEPRKAKVLEDYVVRAKNIKDVIEGYQDTSDSPFIGSKGFFERSTLF
jgi:hypothetical protein